MAEHYLLFNFIQGSNYESILCESNEKERKQIMKGGINELHNGQIMVMRLYKRSFEKSSKKKGGTTLERSLREERKN